MAPKAKKNNPLSLLVITNVLSKLFLIYIRLELRSQYSIGEALVAECNLWSACTQNL